MAMTVAERITALEQALGQGVRQVTYDGHTVIYRSAEEIRTELARLQREQSGSGPARTVYATSRGWR